MGEGLEETERAAAPDASRSAALHPALTLGVAPLGLGSRGGRPFWVQTFDLFVDVVAEGSRRALEPNLSAISRYLVGGVIITAKAADPP